MIRATVLRALVLTAAFAAGLSCKLTGSRITIGETLNTT